ncbi:hypothetical protein [Calothrix sp. 336/3]|uniref:hypothetical protein n=1 Tax=Calothrix sp. 336/3 TaxID=1337936 RepID=UPI0004E2F7FE|nr:hypothetical protein [Calothrix sp. 336/3]AKG24310.1 histidine kinase [Calothrix sp. 336/3]
MSQNIKEQITLDLQKVKETGQLRTDKIREIVKNAVSQVITEVKAGSGELRLIVKDAVAAVVDSLEVKDGEEEVRASIEGALEAVNNQRCGSLSKTQAEVKLLQTKLEKEEDNIQQEMDGILTEISENVTTKSGDRKIAINQAIATIKNSEEVTLLQKRYAQLQGQLAIVKANLAARYGGRGEEVKDYLDDAKSWFSQARPQAEAMVTQVQEQHLQLEEKIGEAGNALARKEHQLKSILRELFLSVADWLK